MKDSELNKAIAEYIYPDEILHIVRGKVLIHTIGTLDYCNNWNDLMPEILKNCIGFRPFKNMVKTFDLMFDIEVDGKFHEALGGSSTKEYREQVTKRALAECLLKVLEHKHENGSI